MEKILGLEESFFNSMIELPEICQKNMLLKLKLM